MTKCLWFHAELFLTSSSRRFSTNSSSPSHSLYSYTANKTQNNWQRAPSSGIRAGATTTDIERSSTQTRGGGGCEEDVDVFFFGREARRGRENPEPLVCALSGQKSATSSHTHLDDPLSVLPGVVVLCILAEDVGDELQLL